MSLSNFVRVPQNIACNVHKSCNFDDLVEQEHFDPRTILGSWHLIARSVYFDPIFETASIKIGHTGKDNMAYTISGELSGSGECEGHSGRMVSSPGVSAVYHLTFKGLRSTAKYLYTDNNHHILLECWTDLTDNVCPTNQTSIYIWGKSFDISSQKRVKLLKQIRQRTFGCYDTKKIHTVRKNTCDVDDPEGRMSCKVRDVKNMNNFTAESLNGLWFLVARTDLIAFKWDSGVIYFTSHRPNIINMKYTGVYLSEDPHCLKVFDVNNTMEMNKNGEVVALSYLQGGLKTSARLIYVDDDLFLWYECHGNRLTANGDCQQEHEQVDVYSRRKQINTSLRNKVS